jgi:hypothetical protein
MNRRLNYHAIQHTNHHTNRHTSLLALFVLTVLISTGAQNASALTRKTADEMPLTLNGLLRQNPTTSSLGNEIHITDGKLLMKWFNRTTSVEVKADGEIEFTDDDRDVKSLSPGGRLLIKETQGATVRSFEVTRGAAGQLQRSFSINGTTQIINPEVQAWVAEMMPTVVRNTAIGAGARVQRMFRAGGANNVLNEISRINNDRARRIYFGQMITGLNLDSTALRQTIRQAGGEMNSDGEKADLLKDCVSLCIGDAAVRASYLEAIDTIQSDGSRSSVLSALLEKNGGKDVVMEILKSAGNMSSDSVKATVIIRAIAGASIRDTEFATFLDVVRTLESDGEKERALSALLSRDTLSRDILLRAMTLAETEISSNASRQNVIRQINALMAR